MSGGLLPRIASAEDYVRSSRDAATFAAGPRPRQVIFIRRDSI